MNLQDATTPPELGLDSSQGLQNAQNFRRYFPKVLVIFGLIILGLLIFALLLKTINQQRSRPGTIPTPSPTLIPTQPPANPNDPPAEFRDQFDEINRRLLQSEPDFVPPSIDPDIGLLE